MAVFTAKMLRDLAYFYANTERSRLESAGLVQAGKSGDVQWERFNHNFDTFILKLSDEKLTQLASMATKYAGTSFEDSKAIRDVIAERFRQINYEGWTPHHDDIEHDGGDLAAAAASYAINAANNLSPHGPGDNECPAFWSFTPGWWKPKSPREDLVRAGALILAEIDMIDRDEARKAGA